MRPEYKRYVKRRDVHDLNDLLEEAAEFEGIEQETREVRKVPKDTANPPAVATMYNKEECCWRCKQRGHTRFDCKRPPSPDVFAHNAARTASSPRTATRRWETPTAPGVRRPTPGRSAPREIHATAAPNRHDTRTPHRRTPGFRLRTLIRQRRDGREDTTTGYRTNHNGRTDTDGRRYAYRDTGLHMLIGVDLWCRLGLSIAPPRRKIRQTPHPSCGMTGGLATGTTEEGERLRAFLGRELPKFQAVTGPIPLVEHQIRLKHRMPIKQRYRPRNPAMQAIIDAEVEEMEKASVIEPSRSAWSSPIVVVTEKDAYPLPQVTATLDKLRGARYFTTLDLKNGYWQVPLARESRPITAFTVPGKGLMQFRVMPFGLHSAPATFQRLLDSVIGPALEPNVFVYLDDIIVISQTFEQHLELLTEVFRRLRAARLRLNPEKCRFCVDQLRYLEHVDCAGIHTDPEKVSAVASWAEPRTVRQIRQFLGMASWYRRFIENFSTIAAPLTRLTKKNACWTWEEDESAAFQQLKDALTTTPVLACPDFNRRFFLQTDASTSGLGAVLTQYHEDGERVIAYASRTLSGAEKNYSATELECLAVIWGIRRMRNYLEGYAFTVITDHQSLRWLQELEAPTGRLARWLFEFQQYDYDIKYRRGALNRVADALSRQPAVSAIQPIRCRWYTRKLEETRRDPAAHPDYRYVDHDHREWDEALPALQFAYNTAVHDATGYTPAFINHAAPMPDTVQRQEAEEMVRVNLARSFQRQEHYYNLRRRQWRPQIGDTVWKREYPLSNKANAFNAKLAPKFIGPLEVRRMISPVITDLRSKSGKWYRHIHIQDLKPAPKVNNNNAGTLDDDNSDNEDTGENNKTDTSGDT
ncbi:hypothetical protein ACFW04_006562 [Cataglyphis niger]